MLKLKPLKLSRTIAFLLHRHVFIMQYSLLDINATAKTNVYKLDDVFPSDSLLLFFCISSSKKFETK